MSWSPSLTKEFYEDQTERIKLKRHKTGKIISVSISQDYDEVELTIVTPLRLQHGEILEDNIGNKVKVVGVDSGLWYYKYVPYILERI
jgi:hypothetical protein